MEKIITVQNETGIHARPASKIVKEAAKYKSSIKIKKEEKVFDAKSIISLMAMAVSKGEQVTIIAEGVDEDLAINAMTNLILNELE
jgi:phosphocarrier protein